MIRVVEAPEIREIGQRIYRWDKDAIYGYGRTKEDYYNIINPRGWKMEDGSYVVLEDAELHMALDIANKLALEEV